MSTVMANDVFETLHPPVVFRAAKSSDHAHVVQLLRELVAELDPSPAGERIRARLDEDIASALVDAKVRIELAYSDGEPIGLWRADIIDGGPIFRLRDSRLCGYVDQMFVRPAFRDSGLGNDLLQRCEAWLRGCGIEHVLLHAAPKAVRFYARNGYQPNREMFKSLL